MQVIDVPTSTLQAPPMATPSIGPDAKSYTIIRIKRKRNEEPLDALVVESRVRRKKSRGGIGVFQYAQTVEDDVWDDMNRRKDIQENISNLARETAAKLESNATLPSITEVPPSPISRKTQEEVARRYTIVDQADPIQAARRLPAAPPKVLSSKEVAKNKALADFKMYDAIPTDQQPAIMEEPSEMDKFLPMLNDYLKIHNLNSTADKALSPLTSSKLNETKSNSQTSSDDDYVWDVFYHRPATLSEWNEVSNIASVHVYCTGLPPSFGDGYDSDEESDEEVDEADEDSNAEEYYKNDYPEDEDEDESDSGDEFHDDSDYDDMMDYRNSAEQFNF
ncbi:hypothetical protein JR316_0007160 [Psilocybe cubensis]|uniref:Uncharacterized protein n=2 Tax=Psilocybe cubensis TaxID=181762 RepID=A0ACB8H030_PSICU|nr:hypothetical protein JR316_0007160 [Psilocybe cubensis]KAH9480560.1 hypothetical protein JR316_0007160 [Psilocybe cubensis]